jgi:AcrR family transcriptional regulator
MTTKEKITDAALTLFSEKGYKGTSVKNIADAVGIKDSSLYKHFKSKSDIFYTIVKEMQNRMHGLSLQTETPSGQDRDAEANAYGKMTVDGLRILSRQIFLFYLKDDFVSRFWKMAVTEQYHSPEIHAVYHRIFMRKASLIRQTCFAKMTGWGI